MDQRIKADTVFTSSGYTKDQYMFFTAMMEAIQHETMSRPSITNGDVVAILSRMIGMAIARSGPDQDALRRMVTENIQTNKGPSCPHFGSGTK